MVIAIIGVLAAILVPTLAAAKRRANRSHCINNLREMGKAFRGFADDNEHRLPWQLNAMLRAHHQVNQNGTMGNNAYFSIRALRQEMAVPKLLVSPCDPERQLDNQAIVPQWGAYSPVNPVPCSAISYLLAEGADMARPMTVLASTHNLSTDNLDTARWMGWMKG